MSNIKLNNVQIYVEHNIGRFHSNRLLSLQKLKLVQILKRKNPYLYKAKNILDAHDLVKGILDAYLSSQEETIFGDFLEGLAIFVNEKVYGGKKSSAEGIDLEFNKNGKHFIVAIKSGPNWGNSSQIRKMKEDFKRARKILHTSAATAEIVAINGCCYGRENHPDKGDYFKYCGQVFWEFISNHNNLYLKLIIPLGYQAKEKNEEFNKAYAQIVNNFTMEFSEKYCVDGIINWEKLVKFSSSAL
jgi:hypothetical protein